MMMMMMLSSHEQNTVNEIEESIVPYLRTYFKGDMGFINWIFDLLYMMRCVRG